MFSVPASFSRLTSRRAAFGVLALAVLLAGCGAPVQANTNPPAGVQVMQMLPQEVSVQEAQTLVENGAFLLDVRQPEEWNEIHVPGATLIPLGELPDRLNEVPRDKQVVVMCRSGNRSQPGREILLNAGYGQVTSMTGGIKEWSSAGFPTVSGP